MQGALRERREEEGLKTVVASYGCRDSGKAEIFYYAGPRGVLDGQGVQKVLWNTTRTLLRR